VLEAERDSVSENDIVLDLVEAGVGVTTGEPFSDPEFGDSALLPPEVEGRAFGLFVNTAFDGFAPPPPPPLAPPAPVPDSNTLPEIERVLAGTCGPTSSRITCRNLSGMGYESSSMPRPKRSRK
jgi:hypothetical protein